MVQTATVLKNEFIAHETRELLLQTKEPFSFAPGQYVTILCPKDDGKKIGRSYSIASFAQDQDIRLVVKLVADGVGSTYIDHMKPGDDVSFLGPLGKFTLSDLSLDFLFVATGTGVAPFIPMIDHLLQSGAKQKIALLLGFRHEDDMLYTQELDRWDKEYENFQFIPALTKPSDSWQQATGRVTNYLLDHAELLRDRQLYICGNGSMINDVNDIALKNGLPKEHVFFEKYNNL